MLFRSNLFAELLESAGQAVQISKGLRRAARVTRVQPPDAAEARRKLGLSRAGLAALLGVSARTVARWERGARPRGAASVLLRVAVRNPLAVLDALKPDGSEESASPPTQR